MTGWRIGWMVAPEPLVRPIERLQQNLAISVPTLAQIAAQAAFDGRAEMEAVKHGYEENRRILLDGLPKAGLDKFLPVDGAFYLYADVSRFSDDSFAFAKSMLEEAGVAATPGRGFRSGRRPALPPLLLRRLGGGDARGGGADRRVAASRERLRRARRSRHGGRHGGYGLAALFGVRQSAGTAARSNGRRSGAGISTIAVKPSITLCA